MQTEYPINQIMQRYTTTADNSLLYSYEELQRLNIDQEFIYVLLRSFEDEKEFSEQQYEMFSLDLIIDYLRRTHTYYLGKKLFEIEQSIDILLRDYSDNHPLLQILNNFFSEYTAGLTAHIHAEETDLLPYISSLLQIEKEHVDRDKYLAVSKSYSLQTFIDHHNNTEKDLSDVRNTIMNYQPPVTNQTPYRILTLQLEAFEKDLSVHALIEDRILIPRVMQLEEKLQKLYHVEQ